MLQEPPSTIASRRFHKFNRIAHKMQETARQGHAGASPPSAGVASPRSAAAAAGAAAPAAASPPRKGKASQAEKSLQKPAVKERQSDSLNIPLPFPMRRLKGGRRPLGMGADSEELRPDMLARGSPRIPLQPLSEAGRPQTSGTWGCASLAPSAGALVMTSPSLTFQRTAAKVDELTKRASQSQQRLERSLEMLRQTGPSSPPAMAPPGTSTGGARGASAAGGGPPKSKAMQQRRAQAALGQRWPAAAAGADMSFAGESGTSSHRSPPRGGDPQHQEQHQLEQQQLQLKRQRQKAGAEAQRHLTESASPGSQAWSGSPDFQEGLVPVPPSVPRTQSMGSLRHLPTREDIAGLAEDVTGEPLGRGSKGSLAGERRTAGDERASGKTSLSDGGLRGSAQVDDEDDDAGSRHTLDDEDFLDGPKPGSRIFPKQAPQKDLHRQTRVFPKQAPQKDGHDRDDNDSLHGSGLGESPVTDGDSPESDKEEDDERDSDIEDEDDEGDQNDGGEGSVHDAPRLCTATLSRDRSWMRTRTFTSASIQSVVSSVGEALLGANAEEIVRTRASNSKEQSAHRRPSMF